MEKRFHNRVALVTGGASGIGKATARMFAREGAKVVVSTDMNIKGGEDTVNLIKEAGGEATFIKCDVSKALDVEAMVDKCVQTYGRLDYAFNNAGIGPDGKRIPMTPLVECPEEMWDRTININLKGIWLCMKYEIKQMLKQKSGAIVNTSSIGGLKAAPGSCAYIASKSGSIGLTKAAALEYAAYGIRVNVVLPGMIGKTILSENLSSAFPELSKQIAENIPMKRFGEPEEVAEAVIWLCSDAASFITGHAMHIDGGMLA